MRPLSSLRLLEERGKGLTRIELSDVAEINLNALLLIGRSCKSLKHLSVKCCHFQVIIDINSTELCFDILGLLYIPRFIPKTRNPSTPQVRRKTMVVFRASPPSI